MQVQGQIRVKKKFKGNRGTSKKYFGLHVKFPYFLTHIIETGSICIE